MAARAGVDALNSSADMTLLGRTPGADWMADLMLTATLVAATTALSGANDQLSREHRPAAHV